MFQRRRDQVFALGEVNLKHQINIQRDVKWAARHEPGTQAEDIDPVIPDTQMV